MKKEIKSELRQDLVSGDWILISPVRIRRPSDFFRKEKRQISQKKDCPFEDLQKTGHSKPFLIYRNKKDWILKIIQNKFPAVQISQPQKVCALKSSVGPYLVMRGIGYHDVLITRDHYKNFPHLSRTDAQLVFRALQERYLQIAQDKNIAHISIFHNWGETAGASIYHPHYQIIGIPVIPPDVEHSLEGSTAYFRKHQRCVHCLMIEWELKKRTRIIYEDKETIAFCPFVSREPFEIRIFPKKHIAYFEESTSLQLESVSLALQKSLLKLEKALADPDYNFFIHTAPLTKKEKFQHYHWHIEILPQTNISAGFELSTGIEINPFDPDKAAKILYAS